MCYLSLFCSLAPNIERRGQRRRRRGGVSEPFCGTRELVDEWRRATSVDFDTRPLVESTRQGQYCVCSTSVFLTSAECRRAFQLTTPIDYKVFS
jgi:hypothetical protein